MPYNRYALNPKWRLPQSANARMVWRTIVNPLTLPFPTNEELSSSELETRPTELTISGPYGNGKTSFIAAGIHYVCMTNPGVRVLIVRNELNSLNTALLPMMADEILEYGFTKHRNNPIVHRVGGDIKPSRWDYFNGSRVVTAGLDQPDKLRGPGYDIIWVNQSEQTTGYAWTTLAGRLRGGRWRAPDGTEKYLLIGDANPSSPFHHLKRRSDLGITPMLHMFHDDNPGYFYNDMWTAAGIGYIRRLKNSHDGFEYERAVLGKWVAAEGLVYIQFDPERHVKPIEFGDIPRSWRWYGSIDYGYSNAGVYTLFASSYGGVVGSRHIAFKCIYKSQRDIAELYDDITALHAEYNINPTRIVADHSKGDNEYLRNRGLPVENATKTKLDGIDSVKRILRAEDGIVFNKNLLAHAPCPELRSANMVTNPLEEFQLYSYKPREKMTGDTKLDDEPMKGNDHFCDTLRYHIIEFLPRVSWAPIAATSKPTSSLPEYYNN